MFSLAFLLRWVALPVESDYAFLTFYPAMVVSFCLYGLAPTALLASLSALAAYYFFIPPHGAFDFKQEGLLAVVIFLLSTGWIGWIVGQWRQVAKQLHAALVTLQANEQRYRDVLDDQTEFICRFKADGTILYVNEAYCQLFGKPRESLIGQTWQPEAFDEDIPHIQQRLGLLSPANPVVTIENRVVTAQGGVKWGQFVNRAYFDESGQITELLSVGRDISEQKQTEAANNELLNRLTQIATRVPGVIYQYKLRPDGSSCFPYASETIREIYRVAPDEVKEDAAAVFAILHPDDVQGVTASILRSAATLEPWCYEYRVQFADGTVRWLKGNSLPSREADGSVLWHGFITDVSDRKAAEERLRILSVAVEQSPASVVIAGLDANILYVNERFFDITGYSSAEVLGQNPRLLHSGLTPHATHLAMWEAVTKGQVWHGEMINRKKDGQLYWEESHIAPVRNDQGVISHYVGVKLDITERKNAEAALRESESKFAKVFNGSPVGIAISRLSDGQFIEANEAFLTIYGYPREQVIGHSSAELGLWFNLTHRDDIIKTLLGQGLVRNFEVEYTPKSGLANRTLLASIDTLEIAGEPCLIGIVNDITERKQIEQALHRESEKNKALLRNASDGITIIDGDGKLLECSDSFCAMLGFAREEMTGMHVSQWDAGFTPDELQNLIKQQFEHPVRSQFETRHRRKDGSLYDAEISGFPLYLDGQAMLFNSTRDITERKRLEEKLAVSTKEIEDLYERAPCGYHSVNSEGTYLRINATELAWLGCQREEVIGKMKVTDFLTPASQALYLEAFPSLMRDGHVDNLELDLACKTGSIRNVSLSATTLRDHQGEFLMSRSVLYEITKIKAFETHLQRVTQEQQAMLNNELVGIVKVWNRHILWKNRAVDLMFGYEPGELEGGLTKILYPDNNSWQALGAAAYPVLHTHGVYRTQLEMLRKNGERFWVDLRGASLSEGTDESLWMLVDITAAKNYQNQIEQLAFHDTLTGLPNRLLVTDRLNLALAQAERSGRLLAICYLDLDGFKAVNDSFGHNNGDKLLIEIALRIQTCIRAIDTVGRIGGDEFVLLLTELTSMYEYQEALNRVIDVINLPFMLNQNDQVCVGASIGVTLYPNDPSGPDTLLRHADHAMYQAKNSGRNRVCVFDADIVLPD